MSIGTLLAFVLVCIGVIILRATAPDVPRPFRTPWVPWVPIAGAVICLAQMVGLPMATWERLFIWLGIGLVIYASYGARHVTTSWSPRGPGPSLARASAEPPSSPW